MIPRMKGSEIGRWTGIEFFFLVTDNPKIWIGCQMEDNCVKRAWIDGKLIQENGL